MAKATKRKSPPSRCACKGDGSCKGGCKDGPGKKTCDCGGKGPGHHATKSKKKS